MAAFWTRANQVIDRGRWLLLADALAAMFAMALPWSTSIATILAVLWLIAAIPVLESVQLRRVLANPAGGAPVLFFILLLFGMAWASGVPMAERLDGLKSAYKLLFIPLLIAHFYRSERGAWVMHGFIASCLVLVAVSFANILAPDQTLLLISFKGGTGVPVRDYIAQSGELTLCVFLLAPIALEKWQAGQRFLAVTAALICAGFLFDIFAIETSRTSLVVLPVLTLLFAGRYFSRGGMIVVLTVAALLGAAIVAFAPQVRTTLAELIGEVRNYQPEANRTRAGERIEFWTKSIGFIVEAPLIGHGTGSIRDQFRRVAHGPENSMQNLVAANPHNQTFATAIQLGLLGTAVLFAMWIAHLLLFSRGGGFAAWAGLAIVIQNIVGSLFNSHLFDFAQGWIYVLGVGVAAGLVLKTDSAVNAPPRSRPEP